MKQILFKIIGIVSTITAQYCEFRYMKYSRPLRGKKRNRVNKAAHCNFWYLTLVLIRIRQENGMLLNWRPSVRMRPPYSGIIIPNYSK